MLGVLRPNNLRRAGKNEHKDDGRVLNEEILRLGEAEEVRAAKCKSAARDLIIVYGRRHCLLT